MKNRTLIILISLLFVIVIATIIFFRIQHNHITQIQEEPLETISGLEDTDGLSDDELNQRLIDAANQMDVVPDDKK